MKSIDSVRQFLFPLVHSIEIGLTIFEQIIVILRFKRVKTQFTLIAIQMIFSFTFRMVLDV